VVKRLAGVLSGMAFGWHGPPLTGRALAGRTPGASRWVRGKGISG